MHLPLWVRAFGMPLVAGALLGCPGPSSYFGTCPPIQPSGTLELTVLNPAGAPFKRVAVAIAPVAGRKTRALQSALGPDDVRALSCASPARTEERLYLDARGAGSFRLATGSYTLQVEGASPAVSQTLVIKTGKPATLALTVDALDPEQAVEAELRYLATSKLCRNMLGQLAITVRDPQAGNIATGPVEAVEIEIRASNKTRALADELVRPACDEEMVTSHSFKVPLGGTVPLRALPLGTYTVSLKGAVPPVEQSVLVTSEGAAAVTLNRPAL